MDAALPNDLPEPLTGLAGIWDRLDDAPESAKGGVTYAQGMHRRPLDYYVARVRKLGLTGKTVLDAGCGTGTWGFALRAAFDEVVGIDTSAERIAVAQWLAEQGRVSGVEFRIGDLLHTGLPDASVDAVYCNGVLISAISMDRALKEFRRIVKPGGAIYVCLNGVGWSYYLRDERGKDDPKIEEMGRQGIYNTLVHGLPERELSIIRGRSVPRPQAVPARIGRRIMAAVARTGAATLAARAYLRRWRRRIARRGGDPAPFAAVAGAILRDCGARYFLDFAVDVAGIARGWQAGFSYADAGRGYAPDEVQAICRDAGLIDFQWACEGLLSGAVLPDPPAPRHPGYFDGHLMVWEFLAFRPDDCLADGADPAWFAANARLAARLPYLAQARTPLLTNVDAATVPRGWVEEAARRAEAAGGERLIRALAEKICDDASDDDERLARLIRFAQDALVHHPLVQPFAFNGAAVTDPATLLFLGIGRCGSVAPLAAALCEAAGIAARVEPVRGHVVAVARLGGREVLVEADAFKHGVMPRGNDGRPLGYDALRAEPRITDPLPNFIAWRAAHARDAVDAWGRKPLGYVETSGRIAVYSSYFENGPPAFLPKVPRLTVRRAGAAWRLDWDDATPADGARVDYRVVGRAVSRGWDYADEPDDMAPVLSPPPAELEERVTGTSVELAAPDGTWFEVTPRLVERPAAFCWPSDEARAAK